MTHRHLVALIKPRRLYSGNGVGWGQTTAVAHAQHVFKCIFLQHMCSINFLIVATPLSYACPASNTCWATVYFSLHKVSHNYNTPRHAQSLH